jgi:hypothetical protein
VHGPDGGGDGVESIGDDDEEDAGEDEVGDGDGELVDPGVD